MWRLTASALLCAALVPRPAAAQPVATAAARTVLAAVVNPDGRPAVDLALDDFVITEGGAPCEVIDVHVADYPVALVLDDRPEHVRDLPALQSAARRFIERIGARPVSLRRLSDDGPPVAALDDDRAALLRRLAGLADGTATPRPALETIAAAASELGASGAPFSAVVVLAASPIDASALVRGALLPQIQDSGAAVHVVQVQPGVPDGPLDAATPDLLRVVAEQTRGQFTAIYAAVSLDTALDRLADRLAVELMVQYLAPDGPKQGDVRVGVRRPGARVVGMGVK